MAIKTDKRQARASTGRGSVANLTYYVVLLIAGLTGFTAYSSGASLEGALGRVVVMLIACTILGYALNVVLLLSGDSVSALGTQGSGSTPAGSPDVGSRLDVAAGEDISPSTVAGQAPGVAAQH